MLSDYSLLSPSLISPPPTSPATPRPTPNHSHILSFCNRDLLREHGFGTIHRSLEIPTCPLLSLDCSFCLCPCT